MNISKRILIQALAVFGTTAVAAEKTYRDDVHVLMYETDASLEGQSNTPLHFFRERSEMAGLRTTVYGNNLEYRGFGDKYQNLKPLLEIVNQDTLIILADARDVALNIPDDIDMAIAAVDHFVDNFERLTLESPNAVVLSAEAQCCVSAMSHAAPGDYFDAATGKRNKRACSSGKEDCRWSENENIHSWVDFMHTRARDVTGLPVDGVVDVYLNAGLMAGYPKDLINLIEVMDIGPSEDDQAVLTGLMHTYPDMLVLDYGQELFGNNQWTQGVESGCVFEGHGSSSPLTHLDTQTQPLMVHTPGKFYACLDLLIEALGGQSQQRYHPSVRKLMTGRLSLAQQLGIGGSASTRAVDDMEAARAGHEKEDAEEAAAAKQAEIDALIAEAVAEAQETEAPFVEEEEVVEEEVEDVTVWAGNYGQSNYGYSNYGTLNYGYGNYGAVVGRNALNYGESNYGYGNYGYGQYGVANRRRRRRFA